MNRQAKRRVMVAAAEAWTQVRRHWGSPLGIHLVACFYADDPWITAGGLAADLDLSEDTVRRKLDELIRIGRVKTDRRGRTTYYKAHKRWAERSFAAINELILVAKCE